MSLGVRLRLAALAVLVLLSARAEALAADRRVALVIGNATYRNAPVLTNPTGDARAFADMLRKAGFDSIELKQNLDSLDLKRAIRAFLLSARDSDVAVVYFAGHGIEVNGSNYVIPVDARLRTDFDAEDEGVALERIIRAVEPARRLRLVILDACRDNPFVNQIQRTVSLRAITAGLGKVEPEVSDTLVAYAARAGSVAEDGASEHSPFTTALLAHLPTPGLDIRVAFGRVRDDVLRATGGKQEPFVYGSLGGSTISIVREAALPEPARPLVDRDAETRRDYEFAERVGRKEAWLYFLQAHPTGFYADLARTQLGTYPDAPASSAKASAKARLDVSRPEARRPAIEAPAPVAAIPPPRLDTKSGTEIGRAGPAPIVERDPCERERATLSRLRDQQIGAEIERFSRELRCEALRPQVARLLESMAGDGALVPSSPRTTLPAAPSDAKADSKPRPERPPAPAPPRADRGAQTCETEAQALERLRMDPDLQAVERFAKVLTCKALEPQVSRLRESLRED